MRAVSRLGYSKILGSKSALNCSDASLGRSVGKWSIEITERGVVPSLINALAVDFPRVRTGLRDSDRNSRIIECSINCIDWNRVVGVGGITADVHDNRKSAASSSSFYLGGGNKVGNLRRQVDAVDKNVNV